MPLRRPASVLLLCLVAGIAAAQPAPSSRQAEVQAKLDAVRRELQTLAAAQHELAGERATELEALRRADRELAAAQTTLRDATEESARQQAALAELEVQRAQAEARLQTERGALASLVRALHAAGRHEQIRLLLAQDSVDELNRSLLYQRYLQRDRQRRAEALMGTLRVLADAEAALQTQAAIAQQAEQAQREALAALQTQRAAREALLADLDRRHEDGQARLRALGRDEAAMIALLESLRDVFADIPADIGKAGAIAGLRGRLPQPLVGKLRTGFAGTLPDGRASKGWWIEAEAGTEVTAVAHGRVAFADWMRGYGLLLILDHGDGYMSLYAGNDALLAQAGDWVSAGQPVGFAGKSGGATASGVYFELRRNGQALDPAAWVRRR